MSFMIPCSCWCGRFEGQNKLGNETGIGGQGGPVEFKLKSISKAGIPEALSKVELYRSLNEPEEAESICRDILAVEPEHQLARRMLGLAITDQFSGDAADRHGEAEQLFRDSPSATSGLITT